MSTCPGTCLIESKITGREGGATKHQEGGGGGERRSGQVLPLQNKAMERVLAMVKRALRWDTSGLGMLKRGGEGFHPFKGQEKMYLIFRGWGHNKF